ncbi:acyl--CoA ligase family protein [Streptosporangium sp. NPDC002544]|uniref:acyl--CoA ligase family protein n=1 Tax=Streptosporangium sp. NPDC002544 TaxID=3154538 RepID=UPI003325AF54
MSAHVSQTPGASIAAGLSFDALTPTAFLDRAAAVHADRTAVIDGSLRLTYRELHQRCLRQAGALAGLGVRPGDRVAVLAANTPLLLESHFGVLYAGAVLVTLNTRLSAEELRHIIQHSGARLLLFDPEFAELAAAVVEPLEDLRTVNPEEYESLRADAAPYRVPVTDERALMALNYTSGTTGPAKGVMYHHRGAYLQALAMVSHFRLTSEAVYLWTLPMFHCNGWAFPWAVTAVGGVHVCLRRVDPPRVWQLIATERVTMLCAAPTVLISLVEAAPAAFDGHRVTIAVGGAPPSPTLLQGCDRVGFDVTHLYGLTETFGPAAICDWRPEWSALPADEQALLRARQGVSNLVSCAMRVLDAEGLDVPRDGETIGEVALRGNTVMLGYYRDEKATRAAAPDGWFRTGDLGVLHPDGYLQLRDRAKDIIISGGENISSIEVEAALAGHPAVLEAAVVGVPDDRWGERPIAFVTLRPGAEASAEELRAYVRGRLAAFKAPDRIEFGELPKTSSGKIRKVLLRARADVR